MTVSKLASKTYALGPYPGGGNRWASRAGNRIDRFIVHHVAGSSKSLQQALVNPRRELSVHYGIEEDGTIAAVLHEEERAFTSSSPKADRRAITVETANAPGAGDHNGWPVTDASFYALAALIEDCSRRYGFPLDRTHVIGHREVLGIFGQGVSTACPGGIWPRMNELVELAKTIRRGGGQTPTPTPTKPAETPEQREERELMGAAEQIIEAVKDHVTEEVRVAVDRIRRENRPVVMFMKQRVDANGSPVGEVFTVDTSPYAAAVHPSAGFVLPLNAPVDGKRGQIASLKTRGYRIIATTDNPEGQVEDVFWQNIGDILRGSGRIDPSTPHAEKVAAARELFDLED